MKKLLGIIALLSVAALQIPAYAEGWRSDGKGWRYQNDDNTYKLNEWTWIDGNNDGIAESYYFGSDGYLLTNTTTPDGYSVNESGAWTVNNIIQTKAVASSNSRDASNSASMVLDIQTRERLKTAVVGDYITFGKYEQDNNTSNGKEDIEWLVLGKENDSLLVISKYALDCQRYNTKRTDITWETCSLRSWLNDTFLKSAFTAEEQAIIATTTVSADKNPEFDTNPGNTTNDKVFLLSINEAKKYFDSNLARVCVGTEYCHAQGAYKHVNGQCLWWLRSPSNRQDSAASVLIDGSILHFAGFVDVDFDAIRPALWIDLDS